MANTLLENQTQAGTQAATGTGSSNVSNSTSRLIDPSDPLYVSNSDVPGIPLVSNLFNGFDYSGRNILIGLSGRNKIAFINGSCPMPEENFPLRRQWDRVNNIVTSWILNTMTKDISDSVMYSKTAKEVWKDLEDRYGTVNGGKVLELQRELALISQGSMDIASYFAKIKRIWDELSLVSSTHSIKCTWGARAEFLKAEEDYKLYQFLMGLNETYIGVRSNIMMMSPLPSVGNAYNILISDEQQRQMYSGTTLSPESASFTTGSSYSQREQSYSTSSAPSGYNSENYPSQGSHKGRFNTIRESILIRKRLSSVNTIRNLVISSKIVPKGKRFMVIINHHRREEELLQM